MQCGVLRGHWYYCPQDVESGPLVPSNPNFPHFNHAVTLAATWDQVLEFIVEPHALLPPRQRPAPRPPSKIFHRSFLHQLRQQTLVFQGNDVLYSLRCFWMYCRSGIFVSIRGGRMELFVPFCNPEYSNTWPDDAASRFHRGSNMPMRNWWMNGWLVCDQLPDDVCGDHWFTTIRNMVMNCCKVDCDFIISKRDSPLLRRDGGDPLNPFNGSAPIIDASRMVRVFSFYGGPLHFDIPCPIALDWQSVCKRSFMQKHPRTVEPEFVDMYFESKAPKAIFRGALTGTGQRALFCNTAFKNADVGCTSCNNGRRKLNPMTLHELPPAQLPQRGLVPRMSMNKQQQDYKYSILLNGHSFADRAFRLFNASQIVLMPPCSRHDLGQRAWFSPLLQPHQHYIPIAFDGSDLDAAIDKLERAPLVVENMLDACKQLPLHRDGIQEWWWYALQ